MSTNITLSAPVAISEQSGLRCPHCGFDHLHQVSVTCFERREDAPTVRRTRISGTALAQEDVPQEGSGNPSRRRHGVVIAFECEGCRQTTELSFAQHKGQTLVEWRTP